MTNLPAARRPTIRFVASISVALLLQACKHPLAIEGEGDIIEQLLGHRGCTREEFQASSPRCLENEVTDQTWPDTMFPPTVAVFSPEGVASSFTLKLLQNTGESPFANLIYER